MKDHTLRSQISILLINSSWSHWHQGNPVSLLVSLFLANSCIKLKWNTCYPAVIEGNYIMSPIYRTRSFMELSARILRRLMHWQTPTSQHSHRDNGSMFNVQCSTLTVILTRLDTQFFSCFELNNLVSLNIELNFTKVLVGTVDTLAEVYPVQCTTQKQNKKRGKGVEQGR